MKRLILGWLFAIFSVSFAFAACPAGTYFTTNDRNCIFVSPTNPLPMGMGFTQTARAPDLTATNTTGSVALGASAYVARVCNTSSTVNAYVALGDSSVTVTTANGILVPAGQCTNLNIGSATYLAGITSSSTAVLQTSIGSGLASLGGGGSGGGGTTSPGGSNTQIQFNNAGSFGGDSGLTYAGSGGKVAISLGTFQPSTTSGIAAFPITATLSPLTNKPAFGIDAEWITAGSAGNIRGMRTHIGSGTAGVPGGYTGSAINSVMELGNDTLGNAQFNPWDESGNIGITAYAASAGSSANRDQIGGYFYANGNPNSGTNSRWGIGSFGRASANGFATGVGMMGVSDGQVTASIGGMFAINTSSDLAWLNSGMGEPAALIADNGNYATADVFIGRSATVDVIKIKPSGALAVGLTAAATSDPGVGNIKIDNAVLYGANDYKAVLKIGQSNIPFIIPGNFTMGNNGAFSTAIALQTAYPHAYVYMPASGIFSGSTAGWYYGVFSSTTAATIYNNTYTSGTPTIPGSPTAFSSTGPGSVTQVTTVLTAYQLTVPGNLLGANGAIRVGVSGNVGAAAGITASNTLVLTYGGSGFPNSGGSAIGSSASQLRTFALQYGFANMGVTNAQTAAFGNAAGAVGASTLNPFNYSSVDSTANQTLSFQFQNNAVTNNNIVIETVTVELLPGV